MLRFASYKPVEIGLRIAGRIGAAGVVVGSGKGYLQKVGDGITTVPDMIDYVPNLIRDAERIQKVTKGLTQSAENTRYAWENIKDWDLYSAFGSAVEGSKGARKLYDVAKGLDYSGIWNSMQNFSNNVTDQPVETVAAAATMLGIGYALGRGVRFCGTRGQGTMLDRTERALGRKFWKRYFSKNEEKQEK